MGDKLIPARLRNAVMDLAQDGNVCTVAKLRDEACAYSTGKWVPSLPTPPDISSS